MAESGVSQQRENHPMRTIDLRDLRGMLLVEAGTTIDRPVFLGRWSRIVALTSDVVGAALRAAEDGSLDLILANALAEQGRAAAAEPVVAVLPANHR